MPIWFTLSIEGDGYRHSANVANHLAAFNVTLDYVLKILHCLAAVRF